MGIVEDYLKNNKSSDTESPAAIESSGIVEKYLKKSNDEKPKRTIPNVPTSPDTTITYSSPEEAAVRLNKTGPTSREFPNPTNIIGDKILEGASTMLQGVGDVFSNKHATGLGKIGSGASDVIFSIPNGMGEVATQLTGDPTFGNKVGLSVVGAAPIKGIKSGLNTITGVKSSNESLRKLVEDIGPENAGYVAKEMRANPNLTPADLSPSVKMGVQKLYSSVEGPHVNYLGGVTEQRLKNAASDLEQHMNANLGPVVNPVEKLKELKDNIRAVGKEKINPAISSAKPVDTESVVKFIDSIAKPGINSKINLETGLTSTDIEKELAHVKGYLTDGKSFSTDANRLNDIQSMFRAASEKLLASGDGGSKRLGGVLSEVRNKLVDAIDNASGGKYKPALKDYRDEFHIQDAFEYGNEAITKNSKNLKDHPAFFEDKVKSMSDKELEAAREGARLNYDAQMNAFKHAARRGTDIGDVNFNKRRMSALFGKEEADKMAKVFEDAKKVADTNKKLVEGSDTAKRNVQNSYFKPRDPDKEGMSAAKAAIYGGLPVAGEAAAQYLSGGSSMGLGALATGAALGLAKGASAGISATKNMIAKKLENERNMGYSKLALPSEGPSREALIQQLETIANSPPKQSTISRANTLSRLVGP